MGERGRNYALKLTRELRDMGIKTEMDVLARNLKGQLKYADRIGAKYAVVIGDNELDEGVVILKDMANSTQESVKIENIKNVLIEKKGR